jgi:signal transduction histidine kinase/CheY-like chemotaxis protein
LIVSEEDERSVAIILIVDDQPTNREYLVTLLGYGGHRLLQAADGAEGLALAQAERPDLIIADILMPIMDGYEFVRQLRAVPAIAAVPVIFYTAHYHEREAQALAQACGVVHVLTKPCDPEVVLRTVQAALTAAPVPAPAPAEEFGRDHLRLLTDKLSHKAEELRRVNERLTPLIDLGLDLGSERDPTRLLQSFCHRAREVIGARYAVVGVLEKDGLRLRHGITSGMDPALAARLDSPDPRQGVLGTVLDERRCCRLRNPAGDPGGLGLSASFPPCHSVLAAPVVSPTRVYGWLCLLDKLGAEEFSPEDERLASIVAAQVGRIYENGSLYADVLRHAAELELEVGERKQAEQALEQYADRLQAQSRRLVELQEEERRHLARDLHDEFGQVLATIGLHLHAARSLAGEAALPRLDECVALLQQAGEQVRSLALELRPTMLDTLGLEATLRWLAEHHQQRTGSEVQVVGHLSGTSLAPELAIACFRLAQEALTNVVRHAAARHVWIELSQNESALELVVRDDGAGFDVTSTQEQAARRGSLGLLGMRERVQLLGGSLDVASAPGHGTRIRAIFPLSEAHDDPVNPEE